MGGSISIHGLEMQWESGREKEHFQIMGEGGGLDEWERAGSVLNKIYSRWRQSRNSKRLSQ